MLAVQAMQSKLMNLSEMINNNVSYKHKDQTQKTLRRQFSCRRKSNIGRHLRQHCRLPPPIPMAASDCLPRDAGYGCGESRNRLQKITSKFIYLYVCFYVWLYVGVYVYLFVYVCVCVYICICVCMFVDIYVYDNMKC